MSNEVQKSKAAAHHTLAGSEDTALLASLIVQQEAFYMDQADYFRAFFEAKGKPVVMHVTVGDQGTYLGQMGVAGRPFALLEHDFGFYILPTEHCLGAEKGQFMQVALDKSAEGPRLMAVSDRSRLAKKATVQASAPLKRTKKALLAELVVEQKAFFNRYREAFSRVFKETGRKITGPVTAGDGGVYAGEVEIGARVFALLEHQPGQFYILPAQNCYHTKDKQAMRVILYQSDCRAFYWLIAVVDKPTAEDGLLADFNVTQSKPMERDNIRGIQQDWDKGVEHGMDKTVSLPKQEVSKKKSEIEKERDFEMEM